MLIGLNGKKQAGKDTVYERILYRLGPGSTTDAVVERVSFADLLYDSAAAALGVTPAFLRTWKSDPRAGIKFIVPDYHNGAEECGCLTFREFLQRYGTEAHRWIFGDNFWVDNVDLVHDGKIVVVTDVRFPNEAQAVVNAGGTVVRVVGPPEVEDAGDGHASEEPLPAYLVDQVLPNQVRDDDFETLDAAVLDLVLRLLREQKGRVLR
jgi:hypothetical protein